MKDQKKNVKKRNYKVTRPFFWNQSTIISRHFIEHNLFITHNIVQEIQSLFYEKYNALDFIKVSYNISIPITVKQLEQELKQVCNCIKDILQNSWLFDVSKVLENYKKEFLSQPENKISNTEFSTAKLFKCVRSLLSLHMRILILNILQRVKEFFVRYTILEENKKHLKYSVPFVIVEIIFNKDQQNFQIHPHMNFIYEQIRRFISDIIDITREISMPGLTIKAANIQNYSLFPVSHEDIDIRRIFQNILSTIKSSITDPEKCLQSYEVFIPILNGSFQDQLNNCLSAELSKKLKEHHCEIEKYTEFLELISKYSEQFQWNFIQIDCSKTNNKIRSTLKSLYGELCTYFIKKLKDNNSKICRIFDDVANKVSETPETTQEVVELISYLTECKDTTMYSLKSKLSRSIDFLNFIVKYFPLNDEDIALNTRTFTWPKEMERILELGITRLTIRKEMLENSLKAKRSNCDLKVDEVKAHILEFKKKDLPLLTENEANFFVNAVNNLSQLMDVTLSEANKINEEESLLDMELTTFASLMDMNGTVKYLYTLWHTTYDFLVEFDKWFYRPVHTLDIDNILRVVTRMENVLQSLSKDITSISAVRRATEILRNKIDNFKKYIPLLRIICNRNFRLRHWTQVSEIVKHEFDNNVLNLSQVISYELDKHISELEDISANATKEYELEQNLNKMLSEWNDKAFQLELYRDTQVTILCQVDDIQMLLDDHILKVQTLRSQPCVEVFLNEVITWEQKLILVQDIIDQWLTCQTTWINLEPIFNSDDITWQMPTEAEEFKKVDIIWRTLMQNVKLNSHVLDITNIENVIEQFNSCNEMLHEINKSLDDYLDRKRSLFARFFFLTNKELSLMISISKNLSTIQSQLHKCFDGIRALQTSKDEEIVGIVSTQNEYIPFSGRIYFSEMKGFIEKWLIQLEDNMRSSIRDICQDTITSYNKYNFKEWITSWPGQSIICCYQIYSTNYIAEFIKDQSTRRLRSKQKEEMEYFLSLMNSNLEVKDFTKISTLIMLNLYGNQVTKMLIENKVTSTADFNWLSQTRYYWLNGNITISNLTTYINYGFECIGNNSRLVITPITDRCFRLIMSAMKLNLYVALQGPSGSGKTEIIKDISKAAAKQLVLLHCSPYVQYKLTNNIFKGIMQCGAWLCLDNICQVKMEMLSVLVQQVLTIQIAIKSRTEKINFEGIDVKLNPTCCFFATIKSFDKMIPSNLKSVFRTVAMIEPDYLIILEVTLSTFGMKNVKVLSSRLLDVLKLLSQHLENQKYDFNVYDVKNILNEVKCFVQSGCTMNENEIILLAVRNIVLPKISSDDISMFDSICDVVFQVQMSNCSEHNDFKTHIKEYLNESYPGLAINDWFVDKIIELRVMIKRKKGVILLGSAMNGKTQAYKALAKTFNRRYDNKVESAQEKVIYRIINPTALNFEQLYGKYDTKTHEWMDGLFVKIFRDFAAHDNNERKWIILDGIADQFWMDYLNPIFDDNKKLHLTSGEVIKMSELMSVLLEFTHLNDTSPATVWRCGILYMDSKRTGWKDIYISYKSIIRNKLLADQSDAIFLIIEWLTEPTLNFVSSNCKSFIFLKDSQKFLMFMKTFYSLIKEESAFSMLWLQCTLLFSLIWGLGSVLDNNSRKLFDVFFRSLLTGKLAEHPKPKTFNLTKSQLFPETASVFKWVYDKINNGSWLLWTDAVPKKLEFLNQPTDKIIVPTTEVCIMNSFLSLYLIKNNMPTIFIGPSGTGKTAVSLNHIENLPVEKFTYNYFSLSISLAPSQIEKIITDNLDRRRKEVYGPTMGKNCVILIDDLNANKNEPKNVQSLELLRQWIEYGYIIEYDTLAFSYLIDIVLLGTMWPVDSGRINTSRFIHHSQVIGIDHFDDVTLNTIFSKVSELQLAKSNAGDIASLIKTVVKATVNIFQQVVKHFSPTPKCPYYLFFLQDIHRVMKSLTFVPLGPDNDENCEKIVKLWIHEMCRNFSDLLLDDEDGDKFQNILKNHGDACIPQFANIFEGISGSMFSPVFNINGSIKAYEKTKTDFGQILEKLLSEYKEKSESKLDYVFFKSAIEHLCRILRTLLFENEHIILVGLLGTGKNFNVLLASVISKCSISELNYDVNSYDKWKAYIKELFTKIGTTNCKVMFKVNDRDIEECYLHDIHSLLCTSSMLNIFTTEEKTEIVKKMLDQFNTERNQVQMNSSEILNTFSSRVISNIHIVFITSVSNLTRRTFLFSSVKKYCSVDWYSTWPKESLQDVATYMLKKAQLGNELIDKFKLISEHLHSYMYFSRSGYVTPMHFFYFIACFLELYQQKLNGILSRKGQYDVGLAKLNQVANQVGIMQTELRDLQPKLEVKSQLSDKLMIKIEQDTINVEARKEVVAADEALANEAAAAAQAIKDDCESDLAEASPALETALTALDTLKHSDITIVKSMKNPPSGVRLVMEALCVLKGIKPEKVQDSTGQIVDDYWPASTKILGDIKFLENLKTFDKDNIPPANMKKIRDYYMSDRGFQPDIIRKVAMACEGLCKWIRAMEVYDRVIKVVAPKKKMLSAAEAELTVQMETLNSKRALLQDVTDKLQQLNDEFAECLREKRDLENQIDLCIQKLERAEKLLSGLNNERIRWNDVTVRLQDKCENMSGDILLAAAFITYLSATGGTQRSEILDKWLQYCETVGIPFNKTFIFHKVFIENEDVKFWNMNGLPLDDLVIDNAVIVRETNRFPFIIDPHLQANGWLKSIEKDSKLLIINFNNSNWYAKLLKAIEIGRPTLIESVSRIDCKLRILLQKRTYELKDERYIRLVDQDLRYTENFRLYVTCLTTDLLEMSDVAVSATVINFAITPKGLENNLLKLIMTEKSESLFNNKEQLTFEYISNNRSLREIENNILGILSLSEGNILDDETTLKTLSSSKTTAEAVRIKQLTIESTVEEINKSERSFVPVAEHASCLFFAISELSCIECMYQFSLQWFFRIFVSIIKRACISSDEKEFKQLKHDLNSVFYKTTCQSLFYKDHLIFAFIVTIFLLKKGGQLDPKLIEFFINSDKDENDESEVPVNWLSKESWELVQSASKLTYFKNWDKLFVDNLKEWKRFTEDPFSCPLPEPYKDTINDFQLLIVIKCLRSDKLLEAIKMYISNKIGSYLVESTTLDTEFLLNSSNTFPILIICSPGLDPVNYIKIIAKDQGLHRKQLMLLSIDDERNSDIASTIKKSIKSGEWVIIQDCHLYKKSMNCLEWLIEKSITVQETHANYRLWITSSLSKEFPITLALKCTKIVIDEKSVIIKNNLKNYISHLESDVNFIGDNESFTWKRLILSTYFLHLIVKERLLYDCFGWNVPYMFDDAVLKKNLDYIKVLQKYYNNVPLDFYKYYIGDCVYDTNISNANDHRLLNAIKKVHLETVLLKRNLNHYEKKLDLLLKELEVGEKVEYLCCENDFGILGLAENTYSIKQTREAESFMQKLTLTKNIYQFIEKTEQTDLKIKEKVTKIMDKVPPSFDVESIKSHFNGEQNFMHTFLYCELNKFNNLVQTIKTSMQNINYVLQGNRSEDLYSSQTLKDIESNCIPRIWRQSSYPSIKPLASYIEDLAMRQKFYRQMMEKKLPHIVWISGLFSVSSFVSAILMDYSKNNCISFETLTLDYQITNFECEQKVKPGNVQVGLYISGLFVNGARWNRIKRSLDESLPKIMFDALPLIYLKPNTTDSTTDKNVYHSPVYTTPARNNALLLNIHTKNKESYLCFPSEQPKSHWIYRSVVCVCQTDE